MLRPELEPTLPVVKLHDSGPNFMALLTDEFGAYDDHDSPLTVQAPNFCAKLMYKRSMHVVSTHVQNPKLAVNP